MTEIASKGQLRLAYLRWAVVTVPFILLLGFTSARIAPMGAANRWYAALAKPAETPPDWVFFAAWTVMYVLMGLALAMVINARGSRLRGPAIALFAAQMLLNLAWSPLFFLLHKVSLSLGVIALLLVLAAATTLLFGRVRGGAAGLMLPYLAWLGFAGWLLYQIDVMNPNAEALVTSSSATQMAIPE